jgi:hypothetical protein
VTKRRLTKAQREMLAEAEARDVCTSNENRTMRALLAAGYLDFGSPHGPLKSWLCITEAGRDALTNPSRQNRRY